MNKVLKGKRYYKIRNDDHHKLSQEDLNLRFEFEDELFSRNEKMIKAEKMRGIDTSQHQISQRRKIVELAEIGEELLKRCTQAS